MGCVSSKILAKSGSFQEKVSCSLGHSFQRSSAIEEIILSTSKSNGDQFLALLRSSTSSARKAKEPAEVHPRDGVGAGRAAGQDRDDRRVRAARRSGGGRGLHGGESA